MYFRVVNKRYHASSKNKRGQILDEFCAIFELKRNYATRLLNVGYKRQRRRPGKASRYQEHEFLKVLRKLWWLSDWQCGKLLKSSFRELFA